MRIISFASEIYVSMSVYANEKKKRKERQVKDKTYIILIHVSMDRIKSQNIIIDLLYRGYMSRLTFPHNVPFIIKMSLKWSKISLVGVFLPYIYVKYLSSGSYKRKE